MSNTSAVRWIIRRLRPQLARVAFGCALTTISGVLATCDPLLMRALLDSALPRRDARLALYLVGAMGAILLSRAVLVSFGQYKNFRASQELSRALRVELLDRMVLLSADYHEHTPTGDKVSRLEKDVDQIAGLCSDFATAGARVLVLFVLNCAAMLMLSPLLGFLLIALMTPAFLALRQGFRGRMQERADEAQARMGSVTSVLCELLPGIPQLQLLGAEQRAMNRAVRTWADMFYVQQTQRKTEMAYSTAISGVITASMIGTLACGSFQVIGGSLTIGGLVALYAYVSRMFEPVSVAMDLYSRLQRVGASVRRAREVLDVVPTVPDHGTCALPHHARPPDVELSHVEFGYVPSRPVLKDVSLRIPAGERMVITGPSGSGKSTLARLLVRFADPQRGNLLIDGRLITDYSLAELRKAICYVPQHPILFSGTIRENLLYGCEEACEWELKRVIEVVQLSPVVARLAEGVDATLGPNATRLSGGEMQRLALGRAVLRNSPILVLDESTSALDISTEREVLKGIAQYRLGRTLIIISHRLSSLAWVDRVVIIADRTVMAEGVGAMLAPYADLLAHHSDLRSRVNAHDG